MEKHYDQIDQYLTGHLPASEATELERQLATDPGLQAELAFRQKLVTGLAAAHRSDLKNKFADFAQQAAAENAAVADAETSAKVVQMRPRAASRFGVRRVLALAAAVAALVVAGYFVFNQDDGAVTADGLFAQHFPTPNYEDARPRRGERPDAAGPAPTAAELQLEAALTAFEQGQNKQAFSMLEKITVADLPARAQEKHHYTLGLLAMAEGRFDLAGRSFNALLASPKFAQDAEWYGALLLLKQGAGKQDLEAAFGKIASSNSPWNDDAKQLLEHIRKLN